MRNLLVSFQYRADGSPLSRGIVKTSAARGPSYESQGPFGSQALRRTPLLLTIGIAFADTGFNVANFTSRFSTLRCSFGRERLVIFMRVFFHPQFCVSYGK
jgi:hypothetical protein